MKKQTIKITNKTSDIVKLPDSRTYSKFELIIDATINRKLLNIAIQEIDCETGDIIHLTSAKAKSKEKRSLNWISNGKKWIGWFEDDGWKIIQLGDGTIKEGIF